jgi:hypothetical protein
MLTVRLKLRLSHVEGGIRFANAAEPQHFPYRDSRHGKLNAGVVTVRVVRLWAVCMLLAATGTGVLSGSVAYASCMVGSVSVSSSDGTFSCVNAYNGPKFKARAASSNDCPDGAMPVSLAVGVMCQKTLVSGPELILRPDERCPSQYVRFVDMNGAQACRYQPASGVTAIAWPRCRNGEVPLITASGELCRLTAATAAPATANTHCPAAASPALDAHNNPICVAH